MSTVTVREEICNMALNILGSTNNILSIENPKNPEERICSNWYEVAKRETLRRLCPKFATTRDIWAKSVETIPAFGYKYAYKYRSDCVRLLGVGNLDAKLNNYPVENGFILCNEDYPNGLEVRFIKDINDVNLFTDDFKIGFAYILSGYICQAITKSLTKQAWISQEVDRKILQITSAASQETPPIRVSRSSMLASRVNGFGIIKTRS
jgi:hypothetical protein